MKLQRKFILVIVPTVFLPILILGALSFKYLFISEKTKILSTLDYKLEQTSGEVKTTYKDLSKAIRLMARSKLITSVFNNSKTIKNNGEENNAESGIRDHLYENVNLLEIRVLSIEGETAIGYSALGDLDDIANETQENKSWLMKIESAPSSFITELQHNPNTNTLTLNMHQGVFSTGESNQLLGYLSFIYDLSWIEAFFKISANTEGHYAALIGPDDKIIYETRDVTQNKVMFDGDEGVDAEIKKEIYLVRPFQNNLYSKKAYTGGELSVIYGIDSTLAIKKAWVLAIQTAQIMAASLLATILIIFFLLRKTVMSPIFKLKTANAHIAKGHYDTLTDITSNDEFGELSSGVHFMAQSIKESNEKIAEMAFKDPLTKLANRRMFNHQLDQSLKNAKRHNERIAVMFLDLDNFKNINDRLGHSSGDKLIRLFAARILKSTRSNILYPTPPRAGREPSDIVARLGGDEFAVMIGGIDDEVRAGFIAKRIIESMAESFAIENEQIFATCSIGISIFPNNGSDNEELIKAADMAMYDAKERGKNRYCFFSDELNERLSKRLEIEKDLRIGIDEKQFIVHYQPQLTTSTELTYGLEALVRWEHPSKGMISPFDFISIAESSGLIVELGSFVMFEACRAAESWRQNSNFDGLMSVNVSSVQFERGDVYAMIKSALSTTGLPAHHLSIELTESAIMSGSRETITELEKIRSLGVQIALDDFGTGYSSLSYLRTLPVDTIKMDRMFVIGCDKDEEVRSIISAIVKMAHALNLKVVAEGIETASELSFMRKVELDVIQGYYYSKPLPEDKVDAYLTSTRSETI